MMTRCVELAHIKLVIKNSMQILAVTAYLCTLYGIFLIITAYLVFCTRWRWIVILYLIWIWGIDRNISSEGGRRINRLCSTAWGKYVNDYFPARLDKVAGVVLDPKRNYLFGCFPHGVVATGQFCAFCADPTDFSNLFPHHIPYLATIIINFMIPFSRDICLAIGLCSASSNSIEYLLKKPEGGNVAAVVVGGIREAINSASNSYRLYLRSRKGFVKLALKTGSPLVAVFTFGATDIYDQIPNPVGSLMYTVQDISKKLTGVTIPIPLGRCYTPLPMRKPMTTLVGRPIDVKKCTNPTIEQIDILHDKFIKELTLLFEENKQFYIKGYENIKLEIE